VRWDVIVRVDAALYGKPNADAPVNQPAQTFTLFEAENMVGREGTGLRLQVPIRNDPGVSRRQALLIRLPGGGLAVRDLGSANGTQLNGTELVPGVDTPLSDGDSLAVGAWTRIAIRAVPS
jgi:pSer/pThr/pTyr-binding forkhead associated (FHA) protein